MGNPGKLGINSGFIHPLGLSKFLSQKTTRGGADWCLAEACKEPSRQPTFANAAPFVSPPWLELKGCVSSASSCPSQFPLDLAWPSGVAEAALDSGEEGFGQQGVDTKCAEWPQGQGCGFHPDRAPLATGPLLEQSRRAVAG